MIKKIKTLKYGSWESPVKASLIAEGTPRNPLSEIIIDNNIIYWIESRPKENGRNVIVMKQNDNPPQDILPKHFNARNSVHEYGGGVYSVKNGIIYFTNWDDQRIYKIQNNEIKPITPKSQTNKSIRFSDLNISPDEKYLVCIMETHQENSVKNEIVVIPTNGRSEPKSILSGYDFYSSPRLNKNGTKIAWICWEHPNMPFDSTELHIADFSSNGIKNPQKITGGNNESVMQPKWHGNQLFFISDRTGWWKINKFENNSSEIIIDDNADIAEAPWVFGLSNYSISENKLITSLVNGSKREIIVLNLEDNSEKRKSVAFSGIKYFSSNEKFTCFISGTTTSPETVTKSFSHFDNFEIIKELAGFTMPKNLISTPQNITFPTTNNSISYAWFYPAHNPEYRGPKDDLPPLIVISHGGPTSGSSSTLSLAIQYWTSRGISVVDVNYRGSSGFGKKYRDSLKGNWGIYDTDDCISAAKYLVGKKLVDQKKIAIRGGSAGGYTTLCALSFHNYFSAGASYYGVADAGELAKDTHKFESRYLDSLIAPYPKEKKLYEERSPIFYVDNIKCPVIIFQGEEDMIVPKSQAEEMVKALEKKKIPYTYQLYQGEQHGFRKTENIIRSLESELLFYGSIFGFTPADIIPPININNF
ncbi:MAG: peptidase [Chloroflexi bacterium]|nr:peptidase [Chloroflexota bacterium]|tara:strand:- start:3796 stop:5730 length:1935 start_codon:yes stop_codon:yes gene_type:complete